MAESGVKFSLIIETDSEAELREYMKSRDFAQEALACLYDIKQDVRAVWKHNDYSEETNEVIDRIYEIINQKITEYDLNEDVE